MTSLKILAMMVATLFVLSACDKKTEAPKTTPKAPVAKKVTPKVEVKTTPAKVEVLTDEDVKVLNEEFTEEATKSITIDNADKIAADLEKEIMNDK